MRMLAVAFLAAALAVPAAPAVAAVPAAADLCAPNVVSSREIPADEFNARAAIALSEDEPWARNPVETALTFLRERHGLTCDTTCLLVDKTPPVEGCEKVRVTVVRDGFADDSIGGDWTRIDLLAAGEGWTVVEARTAQRCRRGPDTTTYTAEPCP